MSSPPSSPVVPVAKFIDRVSPFGDLVISVHKHGFMVLSINIQTIDESSPSVATPVAPPLPVSVCSLLCEHIDSSLLFHSVRSVASPSRPGLLVCCIERDGAVGLSLYSIPHAAFSPCFVRLPSPLLFLSSACDRAIAATSAEIHVFALEQTDTISAPFDSSFPLDRLRLVSAFVFPACLPDVRCSPIGVSGRLLAYPASADMSRDTAAIGSATQSPSISPLLKAQASSSSPPSLPPLPSAALAPVSSGRSFSLSVSNASVSSLARGLLSATSAVSQFLLPSELADDSPSSGAGVVHIRDLFSGRLLASAAAHRQPIACIALDHAGRFVATCDVSGQSFNVFSVCSAASDGPPLALRLLSRLHRGVTPSAIRSLSFAHDQSWLSASSESGSVHLFMIKTQEDKQSNAPSTGAHGQTAAHAHHTLKFAGSPAHSYGISKFLSNDLLLIFDPADDLRIVKTPLIGEPQTIAAWNGQHKGENTELAPTKPGALRAFSDFFPPVRRPAHAPSSSHWADDFKGRSFNSLEAAVAASPQFQLRPAARPFAHIGGRLAHVAESESRPLTDSVSGLISEALGESLITTATSVEAQQANMTSMPFQEVADHFGPPEKERRSMR